MVKKYLTKMIEACENMPHCYQDYLALGKNICENMYFKEYIYFKYGFWTKHVNQHSFNRNKPFIEEPSCCTSLTREGKKEIQRSFGSSKSKEDEDEGLKPFTITEKGHDPLSSSSGKEEEDIHNEDHKSLQGESKKVGNPLLNDEDCRKE